MLFSFLIAIFVIIFDQLIKYWCVMNLPFQQSQVFIPNFINFTYLHNYGAGWGMMQGRTLFFIFITMFVVGYLCYLIYKHQNDSLIVRCTYGLLLGGAVGNLIDRVRLGYVIDMIQLDFIKFPVFNIADAALTLGCIALILIIFTDKEGKDYI